jgi:hypothetical protein
MQKNSKNAKIFEFQIEYFFESVSTVPEGREEGRLQQFSLAGGKKRKYNTT